MDVCIAVDVGGTKLAAGLVSKDGRVLCRSRVRTPTTEDAEALFLVLAGLVEEVVGSSTRDVRPEGPGTAVDLVETRPVVCGVGAGGPMSQDNESVSPLNIPAWREFPLAARLRALTGVEVYVDNDAKALTLGEGWVGAAQGVDNFMGMVVSTGVGGGIVLEGRMLDGASRNAGHVGHVIVEPEGRTCPCGARGCLEAEASGKAIAAMTGRPPELAAPTVVRRVGTLVGRAVASVANLLDLELAVIAGSVALGFGGPFFLAANEELRSRARLSFSQDARIVPARHGDSAPLVGAGAVGWRGLGVRLLGKAN